MSPWEQVENLIERRMNNLRAPRTESFRDPASGRSETVTKGEWIGSAFEFKFYTELLAEIRALKKPVRSRRFECGPILVMAGSHREAHNWATSKGLERTDWVYASAEGNLVGLHFSRYAIVGTFWSREDSSRLVQYMQSRLEPNAKDVT